MATYKYMIFAKRTLSAGEVKYCEINKNDVKVILKNADVLKETFPSSEKAQQIWRDLEKFTRETK